MDSFAIEPPVSLTLDARLYERLHDHLFPGDGDEHGAVIAAGITSSSRGTRLLARDLFLAEDGVDYVPGTYGYRALTAQFVAEISHYCAEQGLCYLAVHNHGGTDSVRFSADDMASHERGYPALVDITRGGPMGALVFAANAVAGDIWSRQGRYELSHATIIGPRLRRLYPAPQARPASADPVYDRHTRLFGDVGQSLLSQTKVGIIGLGGGGSLINEWLARLGVGHIVAVDFDRIDPTNLPRVVGSTRWDALSFLYRPDDTHWMEKIRQRLARRKVYIARRVARKANPDILYDAVVGDVVDEETARLLTDVDFLFLASDTMQSRLVFNALVHQYLIPGMQIGVKVSAGNRPGSVALVTTATRPVFPYPEGGCLECHQLISGERLALEAVGEQERQAQQYVEDETVHAPSVITLNALSAAPAVNAFMMVVTGLYREDVTLNHQLNFVQTDELLNVEPMVAEYCPDCSYSLNSRRGRGDRFRLPCRG